MTEEEKSQAQRDVEADIERQKLAQRLATIELAINGLALYLQSRSPTAKQDMARSFDGGIYLGGGVLNGLIKSDARKLLNLQ